MLTMVNDLELQAARNASERRGRVRSYTATFAAWMARTDTRGMSIPDQSPRIQALRERISGGDGAVADKFWQELLASGGPIVEPVAGSPGERLLTFVYRSSRAIENVVLAPGIGSSGDPRQHLLERIGDTDLWYRTYRVRSDLRASYVFSPDDPLIQVSELEPEEQAPYVTERAKVWETDPLNSKQFGIPPMPTQSFVELPDAPPQPYIEPRDGVPAGTIEREDLDRDPFGEGRRIWTYLPPGYDRSSGPYPVIMQFDGITSRKMGMHITLDNMIAEGIIPPAVCVMMHNIDRIVELPCNPDFGDWLADGFLPIWRNKYAITSDPARTIVNGASYGGLASAWCGLRRPDTFGNVLSQSGSYWWRPEGASAWQWLTAQFEAAPRQPLRIYMDVGLLEDMRRPRDPSYPTMVEANRALRDVLLTKGYDLHYAEFNGGHDYLSWRGWIAGGLRFLLGTGE